MAAKQVTLTIDGRPVTVEDGTLVIRAAESLGLYVPRFCDHPYLKPAGACRQCLVEVEGQRKPLTSCTTVCTEGMVVKTQATSQIAKEGQEGVLELLLINHPLDCPMCDKGGECPLQDQTLAFGPAGSRFVDAKRRFVKPVAINEMIYLDRERCVLCARCTRFADEISGDPFIEMFERGALQQVAIFEDDPYESNFSGNIVQICPVGALTAKDFRFSARPFDMTSTETTCTQCASGCAIAMQSRRGSIVRVLAGDDPAVNDSWICDKGRFGHGFAAEPSRLTEPMLRKNGELIAVSWAEAVRTAAERIRAVKDEGEPVGVITGGNLLDEDAYALSRFARGVLGTNDIAMIDGVWTEESEEVVARAISGGAATNRSIDEAQVVVVIGADLYEESPIVYLRVKKAAERGAKLLQINCRRAQLPGPAIVTKPSEIAARIEELDTDLSAASGNAVVLAGARLASIPGALSAAWNMSLRHEAAFGWIPRKGGVRGALAAGLHPAFVPRGADGLWAGIPAARGRTLDEILEQMALGQGLVVIAGADPATDTANQLLGMRAVGGGSTIISLDMFATATTSRADIVLPIATVTEREGTITNWEGRARQVRATVEPTGLAVPDWEALARIAAELETEFPRSLAQIREEMSCISVPEPDRSPVPASDSPRSGQPSGAFGFDLIAYRLLLDRGEMMAGSAGLSSVVRKPFVEIHPEDATTLGVAGGDRVRIQGANGSGMAEAVVTRAVAAGVVFVPLDQPGLQVSALADLSLPAPTVGIESVAG